MRSNAAISIPLPRVLANAFVPYTGFVVVVAMLFGGGARQGLWSDGIVELFALPLFAWALIRIASDQWDLPAQWGIGCLCAIIVLPLLQLIPLPPSLWTILPYRDQIASAYETAGMAIPWLPVSLDPAATWRSLFALIPGAAIFLAIVSAMPTIEKMRSLLVTIILIVTFISVPIDLLQIMGGSQSPLRFYAITNFDRAVGFFANANHNAAFLYCAMPFAAAWAIQTWRTRSEKRSINLFFSLFLFTVIVFGLAIVLSRAGIGLGFVSGMLSLALLWQSDARLRRYFPFIGIGASLVVLFIVFQFAFVGIVGRLESGGADNIFRSEIAQTTLKAALANLPFGSGMGTFVPVYQMFESRALLNRSYVNHAHNDWVELFLTGGIPAMAIAFCFLIWFVRSTVKLWRRALPDEQSEGIAVMRAASIVIALLMLHSIVDYPLRTAALSVFFAIACGFLIADARVGLPDGEGGKISQAA